ncbi:hypothetical protein [Cognatishimia maritima]|uniref:Dihydroxy-acid dehydratase n=1 Tax=Cognatishimia maritima TaxID=870908 RepID=A0A1M5NKA2_9RHOB|nr:hypothetical protein [Cognatishimia maritima]SHG89877.1 hypothetical protein SAMN04488044_1564 [Cognatishimia maritima]
MRALRLPKTTLLVACLMAAGCIAPETDQAQPSAWVKTHRLAGGDIIVRAPKDYCVARSAKPTSDFVLLARCDALTAQGNVSPRSSGVLTVSTSAPMRNSETSLDLAAALGDDSVASKKVPDLTLRKMNARPGGPLPGAAAEHWRGLLRFQNRVISFAAYGPEGSTVLGQSGLRLLESLALETVKASEATNQAAN